MAKDKFEKALIKKLESEGSTYRKDLLGGYLSQVY